LRIVHYTHLIIDKESVFMVIEAKELSKIYGSGENRVVALDKAGLKIGQGDFISIIGPSGSGKSTLLHLLSGLDRPTSGSLTYDGKDIYSFHDKELSAFRRRRIGFIFQQFNLLPVLTARENIIMPILLDKKQPEETYLDQLTGLLGIQERLAHLPHELSGGQQQRVAIARALAAQPDIIFADEPTGNLDSKSGSEVMELLKNVQRKMDKTLVVITHDNRIAKMADRQFVIVDGILSEVAA
jgi:putative ABC transport system ATP-binding protein